MPVLALENGNRGKQATSKKKQRETCNLNRQTEGRGRLRVNKRSEEQFGRSSKAKAEG